MSPYRLKLGLVSLTLPREEGGEHQQGPEKEDTQQIRCKDMLVHTIPFPKYTNNCAEKHGSKQRHKKYPLGGSQLMRVQR